MVEDGTSAVRWANNYAMCLLKWGKKNETLASRMTAAKSPITTCPACIRDRPIQVFLRFLPSAGQYLCSHFNPRYMSLSTLAWSQFCKSLDSIRSCPTSQNSTDFSPPTLMKSTKKTVRKSYRSDLTRMNVQCIVASVVSMVIVVGVCPGWCGEEGRRGKRNGLCCVLAIQFYCSTAKSCSLRILLWVWHQHTHNTKWSARTTVEYKERWKQALKPVLASLGCFLCICQALLPHRKITSISNLMPGSSSTF